MRKVFFTVLLFCFCVFGVNCGGNGENGAADFGDLTDIKIQSKDTPDELSDFSADEFDDFSNQKEKVEDDFNESIDLVEAENDGTISCSPLPTCFYLGVCSLASAVCEDGVWACHYPSNYEEEEKTCDGLDNDCDGEFDEMLLDCCQEGETETCSVSIGECKFGIKTCKAGGLWSSCQGGILPKPEICDGKDNDCDSLVDEDFNLNSDPKNCGKCGNVCASHFYGAKTKCENGKCKFAGCLEGYYNLDDDEENGCEYECTITGEEICDGKDNNCDGQIDEGNLPGCVNYYYDNDGDGFGDPQKYLCLCGKFGKYKVLNNTDCNDNDSKIYPGAQPFCKGKCSNGILEEDEDCDDGNSDPNDGCDRCILTENTKDCKFVDIWCGDAGGYCIPVPSWQIMGITYPGCPHIDNSPPSANFLCAKYSVCGKYGEGGICAFKPTKEYLECINNCQPKKCIGNSDCGDDGCGGSCGGCQSPDICSSFYCKYFVTEEKISDGCNKSVWGGCNGCVCEKCVCEKYPYCCNVAWIKFCTDECKKCGGCG